MHKYIIFLLFFIFSGIQSMEIAQVNNANFESIAFELQVSIIQSLMQNCDNLNKMLRTISNCRLVNKKFRDAIDQFLITNEAKSFIQLFCQKILQRLDYAGIHYFDFKLKNDQSFEAIVTSFRKILITSGICFNYPLYAALSNHEMLECLLENGAGPKNDQLIVYAIQNKLIKSVELLLKFGVNPNITSPLGICLLERAISAEEPEIVKMLLSAGAKIGVTHKNKKPFLELAWEHSLKSGSNRTEEVLDLIQKASQEQGQNLTNCKINPKI